MQKRLKQNLNLCIPDPAKSVGSDRIWIDNTATRITFFLKPRLYRFCFSFEVNQEKLETLQQRTMALDYPLLAEYDFR